MGHKIFVSYKYADGNVYPLPRKTFLTAFCRDYVDALEGLFDSSDNIYKGESDGEDLSTLSEDAIWRKLRERIYDSSLTIVLISPGMKENKADRYQWIPWEISYSLKEVSRRDKNGCPRTSKTNAMIAVVLPDVNNSYAYFIEDRACCPSGCRIIKIDQVFDILAGNMFNEKNQSRRFCEQQLVISYGEFSYIEAVKWSDFYCNHNAYIDKAFARQECLENYNIKKDV